MATLNDNANTVSACATAIDAAIVAKGGTLVGGGKLRNAAAGIASIPSGSDPYMQNAWWNPPSDWPNLRRIIAEDTHNYTYKHAVLTICYEPTISLSYASAYLTSDGAFYETNSSVTHTWTDTPSLTYFGFPIRWVIYMTNSSTTHEQLLNNVPDTLWLVSNGGYVCANNNTFYSKRSRSVRSIESNLLLGNQDYIFMDCKSLVMIDGDVDFINSTAPARMFNGDYSLRYVKSVRNLNGKRVDSMFRECLNLEHIPSAEYFGNTFTNCFYSCMRLTDKLPDIVNATITTAFEYRALCMKKMTDKIILPSVISISQYAFFGSLVWFLCDEFEMTGLTSEPNANTFSYLTALKGVPNSFKINKSFSFAQTSFVADYKDSFAKFDTNGDLVDGMAFNMNTVTGGQTATISATLKGFFTAAEQAKIADAFTNKGWTLAW